MGADQRTAPKRSGAAVQEVSQGSIPGRAQVWTVRFWKLASLARRGKPPGFQRACPLARVWAGAKPRKKARVPSGSRAVVRLQSILGREHDGDGRLRVVHVECAASGNQFDELGGAVVIADIERNGDAVNSCPAAADGKF